MAKKDIKFTLDTIDSRYSPVGTVKQLDSVFFYIKITENGVTKDLTGQTIKLFAIKEDKKIVEQTTKINITNQSEGLVEIELLNAAIQVHGFTYFELEISDSNGIISTADFILRVNKRVGSPEAIESTNEVSTLKEIEVYVAQAKQEIKEFKKLQDEMLKTNETINTQETLRINAENRRIQAEEARIESDKQRDEKVTEFNSKVTNLESEVNNIKPEMTTFFDIILGKNLIDLTKCTVDKYTIHSNGNLGNWEGAKATDFIKIQPGKKYSFNAAIRGQHFAFYNKNKIFINSEYTANNTLPNPFTAPDGAEYVRLTNPPTEDLLPQLEEGEKTTKYEAYTKKEIIKEENLPKEFISINLPPKIYALEGDTIKIFFDNLLLNREDYLIDLDCSIGGHYSDRWEANIEHSNAGRTYKLIFSLYNKQAKLLKTKETNIICVAKEKGNRVTRKNLYLGDSTIRAELITKRVLERFEKDSMNIELLGTQHRGDNILNRYEGRGGWSAEMWCTWYDDDTYYPVNPFINPNTRKFDVNYYMQNNNYTTLDMVVIHLGINDNLKFTSDTEQDSKIEKIIEYYNEIISSFKKYNSNIKIAIGVTIPPNQSQDSFVATYKCGQNQWRYKRNNIRWVDRLINEFKDRENENIYLVPINVVLDTKNNLKDHVHALDAGYNQIADEYFYFTKYLL